MAHWVVQSNLGTSDNPLSIAAACCKLGLRCTLLPVVPFSKELPSVPTDIPTIFYGSTRFVNTAFKSEQWEPCAFFDPIKFTIEHWGPVYGEKWLNHGSKITTLREFVFEPYDRDRLFFVRPVRDLKEFTGGVWSFGDLKRWNTGLISTDLGEEQPQFQ